MTQTTLLLCSICIFGSILIANLPLWLYLKHRWNRKSLKPFDCSFCLAGWSPIIPAIIIGYEWYHILGFVFVLPFISSMVEFFVSKMRGI